MTNQNRVSPICMQIAPMGRHSHMTYYIYWFCGLHVGNLRTADLEPTTPDRPTRCLGSDAGTPPPVENMKGKRTLQVKASDPQSTKAMKGSPAALSDATLELGFWVDDVTQAPPPVEPPVEPAVQKKTTPKRRVKASPSKPTTPKSKASPKKATPKKNKKDDDGDDSSSLSSVSASCVEVAGSESDSELDMAERLRQRKAALYMEWQDYEGHQHAYGAEAESLESFTKHGLESKGWSYVGGEWTKPVAPRAPGAMKVLKKPSTNGFVIITRPKTSTPLKGKKNKTSSGHADAPVKKTKGKKQNQNKKAGSKVAPPPAMKAMKVMNPMKVMKTALKKKNQLKQKKQGKK